MYYYYYYYYTTISIFSQQDRVCIQLHFRLLTFLNLKACFLINVESTDNWQAYEPKSSRSLYSLQNIVLCQKLSPLSTCHKTNFFKTYDSKTQKKEIKYQEENNCGLHYILLKTSLKILGILIPSSHCFMGNAIKLYYLSGTFFKLLSEMSGCEQSQGQIILWSQWKFYPSIPVLERGKPGLY